MVSKKVMPHQDADASLSLVIQCWDPFSYDTIAEFTEMLESNHGEHAPHTFTLGVRAELWLPDETLEDYEAACALTNERVC